MTSITPAPSPTLLPFPQHLTWLKGLNPDGNSLSTVPALPDSLQELNLSDSLLQGLQRSSCRGVGRLQWWGWRRWAWEAARLRRGASERAPQSAH